MSSCTLQPHSITALWPLLIFHPAEGRRLSWPEWLVTNRGGLPAAHMVTHPSTNRAWHRVTSLIETNVLPLSQAATIALWLVFISHLADVQRLSWPEWLVAYQDGKLANGHLSQH